jgi:TolB protein
MVYIGYPSGTLTHNPREVRIALKLVAIDHDRVPKTQKTLEGGVGGRGTMNVNLSTHGLQTRCALPM